MDSYDKPTAPWYADDEATEVLHPVVPQPQGTAPSAPTTATPLPATTKNSGKVSRRKLFGITALGVAGVTGVAAGGVALNNLHQQQVQQQAQQQKQQMKKEDTSPGQVYQRHGDMSSLAIEEQFGHLLRRAGFGANQQDIETYKKLGYEAAVDRLLNYQQVPDDAMETRLKALNLDLTKPSDQQRWWLLRMAWTQRPLLEKMTLFWHGVLTSSFRDIGGNKVYMRMIVQNKFLRDHAFDTYDNLLLGVTQDPAMLFYLDLTKSTKRAPNENYARELMELFSLGIGNYTQQDVYQAAAALTGWHISKTDPLTSRYLLTDHNALGKTFLGHTGNLDYKDVVSILANHQATPWFICRKLFTFFAYENPTDDDVRPLVDAYVKNNHNMGVVMRTLLHLPQFSSDKAYRARLKSPVEFIAGIYRALEIDGNGLGLDTTSTSVGQTVFDPPNVAGWPGDKVSALWLNSGTWMARLNYIDTLLTATTRTNKGAFKPINLQAVVDANHIDSPEHFVDYYASFLLDSSLSQDRRMQLVSYFTTQVPGYGVNITLTNGKTYPLSRARGALYLLLSSPEYQLN